LIAWIGTVERSGLRSAYANVAASRSFARDARTVADAFSRLGFADVIEREYLTCAKLEGFG
jgi:hypothetical protein